MGIITNIFNRKERKLEQERKLNIYTPIDLGLSVDWCSVNIGAEQYFQRGWEFRWGMIEKRRDEEREYYGENSYKWFNKDGEHFTKYTFEEDYQGLVSKLDYLTSLLPEDDPAVHHLGNGWRVPTTNEYRELKNKCTWTKVKKDGVIPLLKITGSNGNVMYLPNVGRYMLANIGSHNIFFNGFEMPEFRLEDLYRRKSWVFVRAVRDKILPNMNYDLTDDTIIL